MLLAGHLDIDTILSNIEKNPSQKSESRSKNCEGGVESRREGGEGRECARPECESKAQHRCSRCLAVSFCSNNCAVQFWPHHQKVCQPVSPTLRTRKNSLSEVD